MPAINVHFEGVPGPDPVKYLGVFDDSGDPLNREEWREIRPGVWSLRIICETIGQEEWYFWDETTMRRFMRLWRTQSPSFTFFVKLMNVLQSMRGSL